MSSLIQDLSIVEEVLGDVAAFAAGQPVSSKIDNYSVSIQVLPNGPTPPFGTFSGNIFGIIIAVLGLAGEFAAGTPISIAVKENKTWYGVTLAPPAPVAPAA